MSPVDSSAVTPAELSAAYLSILTGIVDRRGASDTVTVQESHAALERPKNRAHGDWASNAAERAELERALADIERKKAAAERDPS